MKKILSVTCIVIFFGLLSGCNKAASREDNQQEICKKLKLVLEQFEEDEPTIFFGEPNNPDIIEWAEFKQQILSFTGCNSCVHFGQWIKCDKLSDAFDKLEEEKIRRIMFCWNNGNNVDKYSVTFEIPQKAIAPSVNLMKKAIRKSGFRGYFGYGFTVMKIITDANIYVIPTRWDSEEIYGTDWASSELREYLLKLGFKKTFED